ncbi:MAG: ABC transporter permease, partial [Clostridia bacterium]|nr:ABC transporter permease [Clostridia bacterium]
STAVDAIRLATEYPRGDGQISFRTGTFETFSSMYSSLQTNAVFLDRSLADALKTVAGRKDGLSMSEILITTRVADALLKQSTLGYLTEYRDLVGLITTTIVIDGEYARIAGVVQSDETAVYMSDVALAKYVLRFLSPSLTKRGADYGLNLKEGETVLVLRDYRTDVTYPKVGETIKIQGREVTVTEIREMAQDYGEWLKTNGFEREDSTAYFTRRLLEERPDLSLGSKEFSDALKQYWDLHYCEYFDYYYDQADAYLKDYFFFDPSSMEAWLYVEKDVEIAKYYFFHEEYYKAVCYKNLYGAYPSQTELAKAVPMLPYLFNDLEEYNNLFADEFYMTDRNSAAFHNDTYLVSDADFAAFARVLGESHPTANLRFDPMFDYAKNVLIDTDLSFSERYYTVIHSSDPAVTEEWLRATFSHLISEDESVVLLTPDQIFQNSIEDNNNGIVTGLVTMGVLLVLMSICMYFIMRSSLMNRIKEVGIYRAIGVSKGNLIFKFFIEAVVLTTLTVFVGYLATSAFLLCCLNLSDLVLDVFYYPPWMAGAVLLILYALGLFCGTLPILSLLRKTPSEILAKYDI